MDTKIQILIIDTDNLLRDGLCALLNLQDGCLVMGALDNTGMLARVSLAHTPHMVVMDIGSPDRKEVEAIPIVRQRWPQARILVLTFQNDDRVLEEALRVGADGYLLKTDTRAELTNALRSVKEGQRYVSPTILDRAVHGYVRKPLLANPQQSDGLSDRERDVMRRIAQGHRTREIAQDLSLSHKTIEKYRSNLMRKLGLRTATAVAAYAISHGYLDI